MPRKVARPNDPDNRGPRQIEHLGGRLDETNTTQQIARQAVDDLISNGAEFHFRPRESALPASFTYELKVGGDLQRCREIIAGAKGRPLIWAAVLQEIARRSGGVA